MMGEALHDLEIDPLQLKLVQVRDRLGGKHPVEPHWRRGNWAVVRCWGCVEPDCHPEAFLVVHVPSGMGMGDGGTGHMSRSHALAVALACYLAAPRMELMNQPASFIKDVERISRSLRAERDHG